MTEIQTTGVLGLLNRINIFSVISEKDVMDVTTFMNEVPNDEISSSRVMLAMRTENLILTGRDLSQNQFLNILSKIGGNEVDKKEYDSVKELYQPEFNTGTNKMGGIKEINNIVMLMAKADCNIRTRHDQLPYEYIEMLLNNCGASNL